MVKTITSLSLPVSGMVPKLRMKKKTNDGSESATCNRFLITINVFGSTGPIRFVVKGDDNATAVIGAALKIYGREGRLPILGSDAASFFLYPAHAEFQGNISANLMLLDSLI